MLKAEFLLLIAGGVFAAEAVSVMLQVWVYRWYKRRTEGVRRRAPGVSHGAAAPPLREAGLGGAAGRDAVLHPGVMCAAIALATLKVR